MYTVSKNTKLSYREQIARQQHKHSNNSKFNGEVVFHGEETFVTLLVAAATIINFTGGGDSFSRGRVFFHGEETFVAPLVATRPRWPLRETFVTPLVTRPI